jgi:hypothetical protein
MKHRKCETKSVNLYLDRIYGSKDPKVRKYYEQVHQEEFAKYFAWLETVSTPDGCNLLVPSSEVAKQFQAAMDRVHARAGYRFIHLLSPVMQERLRQVYPLPPSGGDERGGVAA